MRHFGALPQKSACFWLRHSPLWLTLSSVHFPVFICFPSSKVLSISLRWCLPISWCFYICGFVPSPPLIFFYHLEGKGNKCVFHMLYLLGRYLPALHCNILWAYACTASVRPPVHLGCSRAHPVLPTILPTILPTFKCFESFSIDASVWVPELFSETEICRLGILRPLLRGKHFMDHHPFLL